MPSSSTVVPPYHCQATDDAVIFPVLDLHYTDPSVYLGNEAHIIFPPRGTNRVRLVILQYVFWVLSQHFFLILFVIGLLSVSVAHLFFRVQTTFRENQCTQTPFSSLALCEQTKRSEAYRALEIFNEFVFVPSNEDVVLSKAYAGGALASLSELGGLLIKLRRRRWWTWT